MLLNLKPAFPNSPYLLPFHGVRRLPSPTLPESTSEYVYDNSATSTLSGVVTRNLAVNRPFRGPSIATTTPPSDSGSRAMTFWSPLRSCAVRLFALPLSSSSILSLVLVTGLLVSSTNNAFTVITQSFTSIDGGATKNRFFLASVLRMKPTSPTSGRLFPVKLYPMKRGSISRF